jgi:hypothetical protein
MFLKFKISFLGRGMKSKFRFFREFDKITVNLGRCIFANLILGSIIKGDIYE